MLKSRKLSLKWFVINFCKVFALPLKPPWMELHNGEVVHSSPKKGFDKIWSEISTWGRMIASFTYFAESFKMASSVSCSNIDSWEFNLISVGRLIYFVHINVVLLRDFFD